jgi:hypothetical protein
MSTDKFRDVFPYPPSFVAGEQPKGLKYSRWSAQTDEGMRQLETAVGNLWASFQINEDPYPVLLTNLTRGVGSIDYINPYIPAGIAVDNHTQQTAAADAFEMSLELFPNDSTTWSPSSYPVSGSYPNHDSFMVSSTDAAIVPGQYRPSKAELSVDGDWTYVNRRVYTYKKFAGLETIQYHGETRDGDLGINFAVMPNLSQISGAINTACSVQAWVDGGGETYYVVTMPWLQKDKQLPGETGTTEPQVGVDTVQLELPEHAQPPTNLTDDEIPPGLIMLWDAGDPILLVTASPISESARYYAVSETQFEIRGVVLDGVTLGDPGPANNTRYFLVTMGVSLSEAVGHLQKRFLQHNHSSDEFNAPLSHSNLVDLAFKPFDYAGAPLAWVKDYNVAPIILNNDHPQYLYREGSKHGSLVAGGDPGAYYNAMVGNLTLASSDPEADGLHFPLTPDDPTDDSVSLTFYGPGGSVFPEIFFDRTLGRLVMRSMLITGGLGGLQFGHSTDASDIQRQARFLGPVDIQNTLEVDLAVLFHDTLDVEDLATLESLEVTNHAQFLSTIDVDDLATLASLLVEGTWQTDGAGTINEDVAVLAGKKIDDVDISEHIHDPLSQAGGKKIPVEGMDRAGINGTPIRINAAGYAVYSP